MLELGVSLSFCIEERQRDSSPLAGTAEKPQAVGSVLWGTAIPLPSSTFEGRSRLCPEQLVPQGIDSPCVFLNQSLPGMFYGSRDLRTFGVILLPEFEIKDCWELLGPWWKPVSGNVDREESWVGWVEKIVLLPSIESDCSNMPLGHGQLPKRVKINSSMRFW